MEWTSLGQVESVRCVISTNAKMKCTRVVHLGVLGIWQNLKSHRDFQVLPQFSIGMTGSFLKFPSG